MSIDGGEVGRSGERGLPRSPVAAALLNLTGLALGYAYLGRWRRASPREPLPPIEPIPVPR